MKQHPIPHNILDIEFKLFTKFTIKEFIYIATGVGIGVIFLYLWAGDTLPGIIAFPFFLIFSAFGLFLGIVPINDQKADVYVRNFIKAINSPTLRVWKSKDFDKKVRSGNVKQERILNKAVEENLAIEKEIEEEDTIKKSKINDIVEEIEEVSTDEQEDDESGDSTVITTEDVANTETENETDNAVQEENSDQQREIIENETEDQKLQETVKDQVSKRRSKEVLVIGKHNIEKYKVEIPGLNPPPGSINIVVQDLTGNPVEKVIAIIKTMNNRTIQAKISDGNGVIVTGKIYPEETFNINLEHRGYTFPQIQYIVDKSIKDPFYVRAIAIENDNLNETAQNET